MSYPHEKRAEIAKLVPGNTCRLLDVGCNTGGFGEFLKRRQSVEIWGVEPDLGAASKARSHLDHVIHSDFNQNCPLPDDYFEVITFNDVLEHMTHPEEALILAKQKLKQGGMIIASLPNFRYFDNLVHIIKDADFRYEQFGIRDRTHLRFFTLKSSKRLFEECGLQVIHVEGINERWAYGIFRRLLFRLFWDQIQDMRFLQFAFMLRVIEREADQRAGAGQQR